MKKREAVATLYPEIDGFGELVLYRSDLVREGEMIDDLVLWNRVWTRALLMCNYVGKEVRIVFWP